ncbi:methyl-accepting chemotaxis protein [Paraneptunicella aestuarii]|uniref:methyl-accepting chemotaxis protein n=1 Tax=Paraneptunicella aestuarii TaxID=2831148 RepID=UPI001E36878F|nr:methyl-accepting chemotaxis protein [Paraneptunicella aestuarii]UAA40153.1 methyl-accepting chemotaxis protein [Paraneptunicella aestuarii]
MNSLKNKLTLLTLIPVAILVTIIMFSFWIQLQSAAQHQTQNARESLLALKRKELKNYLDLSMSSVQHILKDSSLSKEEAQRRIQQHIQSLIYDDTNYLFAYTEKGDRIALGNSNKGIGDNFWGVQDPKGNYVVQGLIKAARDKDGYYLYHWPRLKDSEPLPKLSYTIWLKDWNWVIGTGFYIDDIDKEIAVIEQRTTDNLSKALLTSLIISVLVCSLLVFMVRLAAKRISRPLEEVTDSLRNISSGQGDLTKRLHVKSNDEVGQLADSFNLFIQKIHSIVKEVLECSDNVRNAAQSIDKRNTEVHQLLHVQNKETDQVATAIQKMSASAIDMVANAENAASTASSANHQSQSAISEVNGSIEHVKQLAQGVATSAEAIHTLENNVKEISSVLDVIRGIAEQTNLLALNAAIEAARAGEQGRGFAVVADEVRTLASRTQDSTAEIQKTIKSLEEAAYKAVKLMSESTTESTETVSKVDATGHSLAVITGAIDDISTIVNQISANSTQQHEISQNISARINNIVQSLDKTDHLSDMSAEDSHQLVKLAETLQKQVGQFKV